MAVKFCHATWVFKLYCATVMWYHSHQSRPQTSSGTYIASRDTESNPRWGWLWVWDRDYIVSRLEVVGMRLGPWVVCVL